MGRRTRGLAVPFEEKHIGYSADIDGMSPGKADVRIDSAPATAEMRQCVHLLVKLSNPINRFLDVFGLLHMLPSLY